MLYVGSEKAADAEKPQLSHSEGTQTVEGCAASAQRKSSAHWCSHCLHRCPSCCRCHHADVVHASASREVLPAGLNTAELLEQKHQQCYVWQFAVVTERQLASSGLLVILVSAICLQLAMPGGSSAAETPLPIEAFKSFLVSLPGLVIGILPASPLAGGMSAQHRRQPMLVAQTGLMNRALQAWASCTHHRAISGRLWRQSICNHLLCDLCAYSTEKGSSA